MVYTVQVPASNGADSKTSEKAGTEASEEVVRGTGSNGGRGVQEAEQVRAVVAS